MPDEYNPHKYSLKQALQLLHRPPPSVSAEQLEKAIIRHKTSNFEELLAHNLAMQQVRVGSISLPQHRYAIKPISKVAFGEFAV
ncbi:ATP-dependent DNA helicase RecG [Actinobacillus equuli]|nr:ATP-dependent DNA helicase RecG [Actinobacillus equuli]